MDEFANLLLVGFGIFRVLEGFFRGKNKEFLHYFWKQFFVFWCISQHIVSEGLDLLCRLLKPHTNIATVFLNFYFELMYQRTSPLKWEAAV